MSNNTNERIDLSSKVVIITGASSDVGLAIAVVLSRYGAQVVVTDRDENRLSQVAQRCDEWALHGNKWHFVNGKWVRAQRALPIVADITKDDDCKMLINSVVQTLGKVDILINNASSKDTAGLVDNRLMKIYDQVMSLDLRSLIYLTQLAIPYLESSKGVIVNISSMTAIKADPLLLPNCMAKSAVDMFTKCLSLELGPKNVRINSIVHSNITTNHMNGLEVNQEMMNAFVERLEKDNHLGRIFKPEDVANAVIYLISDEANFINGVNLVIDGGSNL